jgi:hypothetical protein
LHYLLQSGEQLMLMAMGVNINGWHFLKQTILATLTGL